MIIKTVKISTSSLSDFENKLEETINDFQKIGLIVEVQYRPVSAKDDCEYIVHNALVFGRNCLDDKCKSYSNEIIDAIFEELSKKFMTIYDPFDEDKDFRAITEEDVLEIKSKYKHLKC